MFTLQYGLLESHTKVHPVLNRHRDQEAREFVLLDHPRSSWHIGSSLYQGLPCLQTWLHQCAISEGFLRTINHFPHKLIIPAAES